MRKPSKILTEQQVAALMEARDHLMSDRLDRSRRVMDTSAIDATLAQIETMMVNHRAALARAAGVTLQEGASHG